MIDQYAPIRDHIAAVIEDWSTGTVTLTRTTRADPEAATPWVPGAATLDVYALDARVDGVAVEHVDGKTILATDLVVIASPKARHTMSAGAAADGAVADLVPQMTDTLQIDGVAKAIKTVKSLPAAGPAAMYLIFVAS